MSVERKDDKAEKTKARIQFKPNDTEQTDQIYCVPALGGLPELPRPSPLALSKIKTTVNMEEDFMKTQRGHFSFYKNQNYFESGCSDVYKSIKDRSLQKLLTFVDSSLKANLALYVDEHSLNQAALHQARTPMNNSLKPPAKTRINIDPIHNRQHESTEKQHSRPKHTNTRGSIAQLSRHRNFNSTKHLASDDETTLFNISKEGHRRMSSILDRKYVDPVLIAPGWQTQAEMPGGRHERSAETFKNPYMKQLRRMDSQLHRKFTDKSLKFFMPQNVEVWHQQGNDFYHVTRNSGANWMVPLKEGVLPTGKLMRTYYEDAMLREDRKLKKLVNLQEQDKKDRLPKNKFKIKRKKVEIFIHVFINPKTITQRLEHAYKEAELPPKMDNLLPEMHEIYDSSPSTPRDQSQKSILTPKKSALDLSRKLKVPALMKMAEKTEKKTYVRKEKVKYTSKWLTIIEECLEVKPNLFADELSEGSIDPTIFHSIGYHSSFVYGQSNFRSPYIDYRDTLA